MAADGGCERDLVLKMNEGWYGAWENCAELFSTPKSVMNKRGLWINAKKCVYEGAFVPTALYGPEVWGMSAERRKMNFLEMKCLRSLVGVSRIDRVRNEKVRRRAGIERESILREY